MKLSSVAFDQRKHLIQSGMQDRKVISVPEQLILGSDAETRP